MATQDAVSPMAEFARRHDPDRFLCALFAPAALRERLFALIAYNHELARAREAARTPLIALMRLQWWRDAVEHAAAGRPAPRHEVAGPLHAAIAAGALDAAGLIAMADAREIEAEEEGIPTREAFAAYLRGTAGGFAVAAGRLLSAPPALLPALQRAGALYGLAGVLRSVPALAGQGRCLLPADALAEARLTPQAVLAEPRAEAVGRVVRGLAAAALPDLPGLRAGLRTLPRPALAAALPLVLARRDLGRLAAGRAVGERALGDRAAVTWAGLRGRV
ncbi:squalene/phytoene synthase family protein [Paracraurococcus lichenis]|uniref:Squalene/phytoene synthase family protein n=1 Tax=Paracraurococcus lichenis TaxID=3064888 RepID=A0ABT9EBC2_9PROT|nr:squalene/phytoene synthase family protein [Paracraurococcus sp. LOR1-02]MDO9713330.1 squalene/phytoene synthase family protein [Paracraurococcus sp. LOR1-02]